MRLDANANANANTDAAHGNNAQQRLHRAAIATVRVQVNRFLYANTETNTVAG
jgi:hypothetical protein